MGFLHVILVGECVGIAKIYSSLIVCGRHSFGHFLSSDIIHVVLEAKFACQAYFWDTYQVYSVQFVHQTDKKLNSETSNPIFSIKIDCKRQGGLRNLTYLKLLKIDPYSSP